MTQNLVEILKNNSRNLTKKPECPFQNNTNCLDLCTSRIYIDYIPKGHIINAEYYSSLLVQLKDILKEKRRGKVTKGVLFLHENAPAHRTLATQKKLAYLGFHCLHHPPYSPDLAPSDYHLFPGLKNK